MSAQQSILISLLLKSNQAEYVPDVQFGRVQAERSNNVRRIKLFLASGQTRLINTLFTVK